MSTTHNIMIALLILLTLTNVRCPHHGEHPATPESSNHEDQHPSAEAGPSTAHGQPKTN